MPDFKRVWPLLFVVAGLAAAGDLLFLQKRASSAGWTVFFVGLGVLAFSLTLGYTTLGRVLDWLPSFPTILGLSFLATWAADSRKTANYAVTGMVLLVIGVLGFAARFEWLQALLPSAQLIWAVVLVVGGGLLVVRAVKRSRD